MGEDQTLIYMQNSPETMDVEMRKIMEVSPEQGEDSSAISSPQAKLLWVVAVITAAGFIAGLLGIGGALIFNPFLLALGVHPQARTFHVVVHCSIPITPPAHPPSAARKVVASSHAMALVDWWCPGNC